MKITASLSEKSISDAIKQLNTYKRELNRKTQALLDAMVAYGEDYAINEVGHVDTGETVETIHGYRNGNRGVIVAGGNAVFLEFGVGIRHNTPKGTSPHPKGQELGYTIGDFGKGQGASPSGWWYYGKDGQIHHTYGYAATLFMWRTARELERIAPELAKGVFKNE